MPYAEMLGILGENNKPREADCAASGLIFFYVCLLYIMHFPGWGKHIEDVFLYSLLYILLDHYIDDIRLDPSVKNTAIAQMSILIVDPSAHSRLPLVDPILKTIALTYQKLITRCPTSKQSMMELFKAEIEGLSIQKDATSTRERYYDIACRKGGYTLRVVQCIVENDDPIVSEECFRLGAIMQLIDDSVDVLSDRKNGIHTIATHDLYHNKTLDRLWLDIINEINSIDSRNTLFRVLYTFFVVYLPDRLVDCYSVELRKETNPLNLFDYGHGCDGTALIVDAVTTELAAMEALEHLRHLREGTYSSWNKHI